MTGQSADPARAMAVPLGPQVPPGPRVPAAAPAAVDPLAPTAPAASPALAPSPRPAAAPASRRGTARRNASRPGGAAPRGARWWAQLPYWISLALMLAGLAWIWYGGSQWVRAGTLTMAAAMFVATCARLVLPQTRGALLVSRRRLVDVVVLAALAVGLLVTGLVLPAPM